MSPTSRAASPARWPPPCRPERVEFEPLGESMLLVRFGERIDAALNLRVHAAAAILAASAMPGIRDLVPAFASLAIDFDASAWDLPGALPWQHLAARVEPLLAAGIDAPPRPGACVDIPVCYGGVHGPDLAAVAAHAGIGLDEVVARHCGVEYRVAMLGFAPGFAYLLGLDPALQMPRRAEPRLRVAPGSVAIGGAQTGIYPRALPGGWQLLGRTPLALFDAAAARPAVLAPGDRVRFVAIDAAAFDAWPDAGAVA